MPSRRPWYNLAPGTSTIAIRGDIGEWGITAADFIADLKSLGDADQITLSINSRGGEVEEALDIYDALKQHPAKITVRVTGLAASAASIIAMAGDQIIMPANTLMMVHNPWTIVAGDAADLRQAADNLDKATNSLIETYKARTGLDVESIKSLLNAETYMTAKEAVDLGFADVVEPLKTKALAALADAMNIPAAVLAKIESVEDESLKTITINPVPTAQADFAALADADPVIITAIPAQAEPAAPQNARAIWNKITSAYK
jgi:ATP-dependent Clp endopeptidase proteolytic subunit ClpP